MHQLDDQASLGQYRTQGGWAGWARACMHGAPKHNETPHPAAGSRQGQTQPRRTVQWGCRCTWMQHVPRVVWRGRRAFRRCRATGMQGYLRYSQHLKLVPHTCPAIFLTYWEFQRTFELWLSNTVAYSVGLLKVVFALCPGAQRLAKHRHPTQAPKRNAEAVGIMYSRLPVCMLLVLLAALVISPLAALPISTSDLEVPDAIPMDVPSGLPS